MRELMWVCGLLQADVRERIIETCAVHNGDLCLSRRFIDFPLHVSFKRSFYCDRFEDVKRDLKKMITGYGRIGCGTFHPVRVKDMIWLRFDDEEGLKDLHGKIDLFLQEKHDIEIDAFDRNYVPHATLFRDDDQDKLDRMFERLNETLIKEDVSVDSFFIGSRNHENRYYDL